MSAAATETRARALVAELEQLVRMAARRPSLHLREGEPGCNWSFTWARDLVTVDPDQIRLFAPDLCRGLALHEATHAAVTRYHTLLSRPLLHRYGTLLNCIEDIRIEIWMRSKFPGAIPWIRAYNDALFVRTGPLPRSRQAQFTWGVLETWWFGGLSPGLLPEVLEALEATRQPVVEATACQPPLDENEPLMLAAQQGMWNVVKARIAPIWDRLVTADEREGIGSLAAEEMANLTGAPAFNGTASGSMSVRRLLGAETDRSSSAGGANTAAEASSAISAALGTDGRDTYLAAWRRVAPLAESLGDELLRELVPNQRLRWTRGHPSGTRIDIRRAMQFTADPRLYRSLWMRPVVPTRQDPAFLMLIDRSASMTDDTRIESAFDGLVLLTEVCRRIGVHTAAASFASDYREELPWDGPLDDSARRRLGLLLRSCDGNTRLGLALSRVRRMLARHHGSPKIVIVLSDGAPSDPDLVKREVAGMQHEGIHAIGLGLGKGTTNLADLFPHAITDIPPAALVGRITELIRESMIARSAGRH